MKEINTLLNETFMLINTNLLRFNIGMIFLIIIVEGLKYYNLRRYNVYEIKLIFMKRCVAYFFLGIGSIFIVLLQYNLKTMKMFTELDDYYIFLLVTYWVVGIKKILSYSSSQTCYMNCFRYENDTNPSIFSHKNAGELYCYQMITVITCSIDREKLRLDILKYLVSPAVITPFLISENEGVFLYVLIFGLALFLWVTYESLVEYQAELQYYQSTYYKIKYGIKYTKDEIDAINKEQDMFRYGRIHNRYADLMEKAINLDSENLKNIKD